MTRSCSMISTMFVLCLAAVPLARAEVEEVAEASSVSEALSSEDTCDRAGEGSEECSLSLRQLRGEAKSAPAEIPEVTSVPQEYDHLAPAPSMAEAASEVQGAGETNQAPAPVFNYNWYVGGQKPNGPEVQQAAPSPSGAPVFNYNWHINFGMDDKTVKQGTCRSFGCRGSFDMNHLSDACQCFPGCDQTQFGNVCCSDYQQTCVGGSSYGSSWGHGGRGARRQARPNRNYYIYSNTYCHRGYGGDELWSAEHVSNRLQCRKSCLEKSQCRGYVHDRRNRMCQLLSRVDITHCQRRGGFESAMRHGGGGGKYGGTGSGLDAVIAENKGSSYQSSYQHHYMPMGGYHPALHPGVPSYWHIWR